MIGSYGIQGDASESLSIFNDMLREEVKPNKVIFTTILSACSHTGMVGEGWNLFISMCQEYNFVPSMKHYACMVDLLARSGRLEEAWDFIEKMPVQPDFSLFGARDVAMSHCKLICHVILFSLILTKIKLRLKLHQI